MAGRTEFPVVTLIPKCVCPKCGGANLTELEKLPVDCPVHGRENARLMRCDKDKTEFYCHETDVDEPGKCECPVCHKPPQESWVKDVEELPNGIKKTYACPRCAEHPAPVEFWCVFPPEPPKCKCPKCGNDDMSQFEQIGQPQVMADGKFDYTFKCKKCKTDFHCAMDNDPKCECPDCHKFDATEVSRSKVADVGGKEVWRVKYKCKCGQVFECDESAGKECKCPNCGGKERTEVGRTTNPDGSTMVRFRCKCGTEYDCMEGEGAEGECKCPKCNKCVAEFPDEFEEAGATENPDGSVTRHYKHKPDGEKFDCCEMPGKGEFCRCPKCKSTDSSDWEEIGRRKSENGDIVKYRCKKDNATFECQEQPGGPCKCPTCNNADQLAEIRRENGGNGSVIHYRCKKGHKKHADKCSLGLPECVVDCVEVKDGDPKCECPKCHAKQGDGLVTLGEDVIDMNGKRVTVKHMKCTKCHFVSGQCTTGKWSKEEAIECFVVVDEPPKCPKCGSHKIRIIHTEVVK